MQQNDKTIFKYLEPSNNDMFSMFNKEELNQIFTYLNKYYLEYRNSLGLSDDITFGIEIEFEHFKGGMSLFSCFQELINKTVGNDRWETKNDVSLYHDNLDYGREISSDILRDNLQTWIDIKNVCNVASNWGVIGNKCGGHVHVGAHILGENTLYWYRFIKLCCIYENIIYRFCYGEYLIHRLSIYSNAKPAALLYSSRLPIIKKELDNGVFRMLLAVDSRHPSTDSLKDYGLSFWHMQCDNNFDLYEDYNKVNKYCTFELRCPNGTFDYVIWQNNINFIIKMLLYCKSSKFDEDILDKRYVKVCSIFDDLCSYSKIYLDQAIELCDMIFDNNLDKLYFLRQYIKSFEVSNKDFVKCRKFTDTFRVNM